MIYQCILLGCLFIFNIWLNVYQNNKYNATGNWCCCG